MSCTRLHRLDSPAAWQAHTSSSRVSVSGHRAVCQHATPPAAGSFQGKRGGRCARARDARILVRCSPNHRKRPRKRAACREPCCRGRAAGRRPNDPPGGGFFPRSSDLGPMVQTYFWRFPGEVGGDEAPPAEVGCVLIREALVRWSNQAATRRTRLFAVAEPRSAALLLRLQALSDAEPPSFQFLG